MQWTSHHDISILLYNFYVNSLAPWKFEWNFKYVIFKWILVIGGWGISCEIALIWTSLDFTDDQSTLVQVVAWCCQATSHYLSQCWPRFLPPYSVTTPFDKSNGRFFSDVKIDMMPSPNLHDFWSVYWMHVHVHFPCKTYWPFGLTFIPRGRKTASVTFF